MPFLNHLFCGDYNVGRHLTFSANRVHHKLLYDKMALDHVLLVLIVDQPMIDQKRFMVPQALNGSFTVCSFTKVILKGPNYCFYWIFNLFASSISHTFNQGQSLALYFNKSDTLYPISAVLAFCNTRHVVTNSDDSYKIRAVVWFDIRRLF